jgi:hypothetical protein
MVLLTKQGWRLIQNPETLVAKILLKKYFPNGEFLEASLGYKSSYAWRSIWNSRRLLREGIIWRVGTGSRIRIWDEPWLPSPGNHFVESPVRLLGRDATVSELLDINTNWWNMELVHAVFNMEEASRICKMGVCPCRGIDMVA